MYRSEKICSVFLALACLSALCSSSESPPSPKRTGTNEQRAPATTLGIIPLPQHPMQQSSPPSIVHSSSDSNLGSSLSSSSTLSQSTSSPVLPTLSSDRQDSSMLQGSRSRSLSAMSSEASQVSNSSSPSSSSCSSSSSSSLSASDKRPRAGFYVPVERIVDLGARLAHDLDRNAPDRIAAVLELVGITKAVLAPYGGVLKPLLSVLMDSPSMISLSPVDGVESPLSLTQELVLRVALMYMPSLRKTCSCARPFLPLIMLPKMDARRWSAFLTERCDYADGKLSINDLLALGQHVDPGMLKTLVEHKYAVNAASLDAIALGTVHGLVHRKRLLLHIIDKCRKKVPSQATFSELIVRLAPEATQVPNQSGVRAHTSVPSLNMDFAQPLPIVSLVSSNASSTTSSSRGGSPKNASSSVVSTIHLGSRQSSPKTNDSAVSKSSPSPRQYSPSSPSSRGSSPTKASPTKASYVLNKVGGSSSPQSVSNPPSPNSASSSKVFVDLKGRTGTSGPPSRSHSPKSSPTSGSSVVAAVKPETVNKLDEQLLSSRLNSFTKRLAETKGQTHSQSMDSLLMQPRHLDESGNAPLSARNPPTSSPYSPSATTTSVAIRGHSPDNFMGDMDRSKSSSPSSQAFTPVITRRTSQDRKARGSPELPRRFGGTGTDGGFQKLRRRFSQGTRERNLVCSSEKATSSSTFNSQEESTSASTPPRSSSYLSGHRMALRQQRKDHKTIIDGLAMPAYDLSKLPKLEDNDGGDGLALTPPLAPRHRNSEDNGKVKKDKLLKRSKSSDNGQGKKQSRGILHRRKVSKDRLASNEAVQLLSSPPITASDPTLATATSVLTLAASTKVHWKDDLVEDGESSQAKSLSTGSIGTLPGYQDPSSHILKPVVNATPSAIDRIKEIDQILHQLLASPRSIVDASISANSSNDSESVNGQEQGGDDDDHYLPLCTFLLRPCGQSLQPRMTTNVMTRYLRCQHQLSLAPQTRERLFFSFSSGALKSSNRPDHRCSLDIVFYRPRRQAIFEDASQLANGDLIFVGADVQHLRRILLLAYGGPCDGSDGDEDKSDPGLRKKPSAIHPNMTIIECAPNASLVYTICHQLGVSVFEFVPLSAPPHDRPQAI